MAATVNIYEWTSAGVQAIKTSGTIRFKNANDATVDLNDPLAVPSAGNRDYSFEKWLRLKIDDPGGFAQISNLRAYSDGANNFGAGINAWYAAAGAFMTPVQPDESLDPPRSAAAGSPIDLDALNPGPFTDGSPAEWIGDFLVLVMEVEDTASNGVLPTETLTFAWDEI
jgi:hypothetical protein